MNSTYGIVAVAIVVLVTVTIGAFGLRISRTTSDFYVASRSVGPFWNASAIGGEYLSAASFLGFAGLILAYGADMLWYGVGWTAGYLILLLFIAAPLRRSGAYTIPDFAEARLESIPTRYVSTLLIVVIGWLYLMPQFQGAGLTLRTVTGAPAWSGGVLVAAVVLVSVVAGGMRSITFVQAFQYWLKLTALLIPLILLLRFWVGDGVPTPSNMSGTDWTDWLTPLAGRDNTLYRTYSLMVATFLGTMGLPHVLVRFYTNPDGRAARRTTLLVLGLLGMFYVLPTMYGVLGRIYASDLIGDGRSDAVVLELPGRVIGGTLGELLGALLTAGAFAAFLSTSSGLAVSVAGVLSQDVLSRRLPPVTAFRAATVVAVLVPVVLAVSVDDINVATSVGLAFAVAASTLCPLLVLGIWWRGLTAYGAAVGMLGGGLASGGAVIATLADAAPPGLLGAMLNQPALWSVPFGFALMIGVSVVTRRHVAPNVNRTMVRLHTPEQIDVDRGAWVPEK